VKKVPENIDAFLAEQPIEVRIVLEKLRQTILSNAPGAIEVISYGMPAFKYEGKMLVGFSSFKNHCSLFPWDSSTTTIFAKELIKFKTSKGTIQFTLDKLIPERLLIKILRYRMEKNSIKKLKK